MQWDSDSFDKRELTIKAFEFYLTAYSDFKKQPMDSHITELLEKKGLKPPSYD
jgi:hypothetical protein